MVVVWLAFPARRLRHISPALRPEARACECEAVRASRIQTTLAEIRRRRVSAQRGRAASCSCSVGALAFFPCPSSFCSVTARLLCERATTTTTGHGEGEGRRRGDVAGMCPLLTLPACSARLPPRHRYGWQIATIPIQVVRKTVTRRLVFGLCAPLVAALFVVAVWLLPRQASFMPTTRIPVLLRKTRMKLAAPIVDKCLVRDGQHHHPATLTCAAGSLGREERSALLVSSPPAAGYPARSICSERRALRAKALNLPSL